MAEILLKLLKGIVEGVAALSDGERAKFRQLLENDHQLRNTRPGDALKRMMDNSAPGE